MSAEKEAPKWDWMCKCRGEESRSKWEELVDNSADLTPVEGEGEGRRLRHKKVPTEQSFKEVQPGSCGALLSSGPREEMCLFQKRACLWIPAAQVLTNHSQ